MKIRPLFRIGVLAVVPVVVASACASGGGGVIDTIGDGGGRSDGAGGQDARDGDGSVTGCPPRAPRSGAPCSGSPTCSYGCDNGGPGSAVCQGGKWNVQFGEQPCPVDGASFACGSETCTPSEYCVQPCCGGPAPFCGPMPDSGVCPPGTQAGVCPGGGGSGCVDLPCTPAPPYCTPSATPPGGCVIQPGSRSFVCACA